MAAWNSTFRPGRHGRHFTFAITNAPVAGFTGTPLTGAVSQAVTFTDTTLNTPTTWAWEKNSGAGWVAFAGTPTVQNPVETFITGTWSVRLTATNAHTSNSFTRTDYIVIS